MGARDRSRDSAEPPPAPRLTTPLRRVLIGDAVITGAGYAFGPMQWTTSPTLNIVESYGLPWVLWGILYLVGAVLLMSSRSPAQMVAGHGFLALLYLVWGLSTAATGVTGQLAAWGSPVHVLAIACVHLLALWRARSATVAAGRPPGR
jgi:hypothetical protein